MRVDPRLLKVAAAFALFWSLVVALQPASCLVWNATPSFPTGLYYLDRSASGLREGALVYFSEPLDALELARSRGYIPARGNFMKRIGALPGDEYCVDLEAGRLFVNGADYGPVFEHDSTGRPLPTRLRNGCALIPPHHFLPLSPVPRSFDGRYYGPISLQAIEGSLTPISTKP